MGLLAWSWRRKYAKAPAARCERWLCLFHDAHLVYCLRSPQCRTTSMGLSWTAYSVVSPLLASRPALVRLWCLEFFSLDVRRYQATPCSRVPPFSKHLETDVFWVVTSFAVFFTVGLPANLLGTSSQAHQLAMSLNVAKFYLG